MNRIYLIAIIVILGCTPKTTQQTAGSPKPANGGSNQETGKKDNSGKPSNPAVIPEENESIDVVVKPTATPVAIPTPSPTVAAVVPPSPSPLPTPSPIAVIPTTTPTPLAVVPPASPTPVAVIPPSSPPPVAVIPPGNTPPGVIPPDDVPPAVIPPTGPNTPIVLDLERQNRFMTSKKLVSFDLNNTGVKSLFEWPGSKVAFLVLDLNENSQIDSGAEMFGSGTMIQSTGLKAKDGFEALSQYDSNKDGLIDARDPVFIKLQLWVDLNSNGFVDSNELQSIRTTDILELNLTDSIKSRVSNKSNCSFFLLNGSYKTRASKTYYMNDVVLCNQAAKE